MTPAELERELRACLTGQAARNLPVTNDLARVAIRQVNRVRRRRTAGGAVALVVATTVAGAGMVQFGGAPERGPTLPSLVAEPTSPPLEPDSRRPSGPDPARSIQQREIAIAPSQLKVAVVTGKRLVGTAGAPIDLARVGEVAGAYGVATGWLVLGGKTHAPSSLWYVRGGKREARLLSDVDGLAVSPDGTRVAWRRGAALFAAGLVNGVLTAQGQTSAPEGSTPVGFVGTHVLLSRTRLTTTAAATEIGVWTPGPSSASPEWRAGALAAYGTLPDGHTVVALLSDSRSTDSACVGLLDAAQGLAVRDRACDLPVIAGRGSVSPDGHWLVATGRKARAVLIDLSTAFDGTPVAHDAGPNPEGPAVWVDGRTLVHGSNGRLTRLRLDKLAGGDAAGVEPIKVAGLFERELAQVVPHLGI